MSDEIASLAAKLGLEVDTEAWAKGDNQIKAMTVALGNLIAKGIEKVAEAFVEVIHTGEQWIEQTLEFGGHLDDLRQQVGLSAEALQEYGYISKLGGGSIDEFAFSVQKLSRVLGESAHGGKEATQTLRKIGLSAKDVKNALKSGAGLDEAILKIADGFQKLPDGAEKTALAMHLFGRSGAKLIPFLNQGRAGIAGLKKEARDLGIIMSEDAVSAADELGDNVDKLKMSWDGFKRQVVTSLFPVFKEGIDKILAWVKANRELISVKVKEFAAAAAKGIYAIVDAIKWLYDNRATFIHYFSAVGKVLQDTFGGLAAIFEALKTVKNWLQPVFDWLDKVLTAIGSSIDDILAKVGIESKKKTDVNAPLTEQKGGFRNSGVGVGSIATDIALAPLGIGGPKLLNDIRKITHGGDPTVAAIIKHTLAGQGMLPTMTEREAGATPTQVNVTAPITVNPSPGMDEEKLGQHVQDKLEQTFAGKLREAMGAVK